jgi:hypothetical protein
MEEDHHEDRDAPGGIDLNIPIRSCHTGVSSLIRNNYSVPGSTEKPLGRGYAIMVRVISLNAHNSQQE